MGFSRHLDINSLLVLQKIIFQLLSNSGTRHSDYSFPPSNPLFFKEQLVKVQDIFKMRIVFPLMSGGIVGWKKGVLIK